MTYNVFKHFSHRWVCISSFDEHSIFCVFCKFGLSLLKKPFRSLGFGLSATINSQLKTHLLKRSSATRGARSSYKWETPRPKQDAGLPPPPSRFPRPTLTPAARTRLSSPLAALPPLTPPGPARPWQPHAQLPLRHIRHPGGGPPQYACAWSTAKAREPTRAATFPAASRGGWKRGFETGPRLSHVAQLTHSWGALWTFGRAAVCSVTAVRGHSSPVWARRKGMPHRNIQFKPRFIFLLFDKIYNTSVFFKGRVFLLLQFRGRDAHVSNQHQKQIKPLNISPA